MFSHTSKVRFLLFCVLGTVFPKLLRFTHTHKHTHQSLKTFLCSSKLSARCIYFKLFDFIVRTSGIWKLYLFSCFFVQLMLIYSMLLTMSVLTDQCFLTWVQMVLWSDRWYVKLRDRMIVISVTHEPLNIKIKKINKISFSAGTEVLNEITEWAFGPGKNLSTCCTMRNVINVQCSTSSLKVFKSVTRSQTCGILITTTSMIKSILSQTFRPYLHSLDQNIYFIVWRHEKLSKNLLVGAFNETCIKLS